MVRAGLFLAEGGSLQGWKNEASGAGSFLPENARAKEQVTDGELTETGSRAMGQPGSRGGMEWQLRTADVLKTGGRLSGSEAGSQSRGACLVDY